jgi:hypothetical protein
LPGYIHPENYCALPNPRKNGVDRSAQLNQIGGTCTAANCDCVGFAYQLFTTYAGMQPNWYSSYTPKTAAGLTAMNSELLDFVKFFRGTQYYTTAWDVNYTFGTTTPTIGA